MRISPLIALAAAGSLLAGAAHAELEDYHGFDKEVVDALNDRMEEPLTSELLAALSGHVGIEACGGDNVVEERPPEGWVERIKKANAPGGDVVMPIPTGALAPDYPPLFSALGVEGTCEVMFDVTATGETENILANCTMPPFTKATKGMLADLEFTAGEGADSPATKNIIIPVQYCRPDKEEGG
ncbi:MAG: hypothetical protein RIB03_05650 [Henriciella sp.]|uniref:hypothetical protein n=1 Tax=Henriciella sp. TaxID=1968823 RepID=UPI002627F3B9|nr:hypothetical protein [Henriciella sp.]